MSQSAVWSAHFSPVLATVSGTIAVGDVLTRLPGTDGGYVIADTANLVTGLRPRAVSITANSGGTRTTVLAISQGEIDSVISGLGSGTEGNVYVSSNGRLTRTQSASGLVVGWTDTEGNCMLNMQAGALYQIVEALNGYVFDIRNYGTPQAAMDGDTDCSYGLAALRLAALSTTNGKAGGGTAKYPRDANYPGSYYRHRSAIAVFDQDTNNQGAQFIIEGDGGAAALGFDTGLSGLNSATWLHILDNRDTVTFRNLNLFSEGQTTNDVIGRLIVCNAHAPGWYVFEQCRFYGFAANLTGLVYVNAAKLRMRDCAFGGCIFTASGGAVLRGDNLSDVAIDGLHVMTSDILGATTYSTTGTAECGIRLNGQGEHPITGRGIHPWQLRRIQMDANWDIGIRLGGNGGVGLGSRVTNIQVEDCSIGVGSANYDGIGLQIEYTDHAEIRRCWMGTTAVPLSRAVYCTNVTHVILDRVQTDITGVASDGRSANRIHVDSNCTSLEVSECEYSLLEATKVARVRITKNGVTWDVTQNATSGACTAKRTRDIEITATGGGTGTAKIPVRPEASTELCARVSCIATDGEFAAKTDAIFRSAGSVATLGAAGGASANPATEVGLNDVSDAAFGTSSAIWTAGGAAGTADSDKAVLTVTNGHASAQSFVARIEETIRWGSINPAMFLELFGSIIDAWYDDTSMVDTGGVVAHWYDRSGNHYDLTGSGAARPVYNGTANNSLPGAEFDGVNDLLTGTLTTSRTMGTIFAVGTMTAAGSTIASISSSGASFAAGGARLRQQDSTYVSCDISGGTAGTFIQAPGSTFRTFAGTYFGSRAIAWVDGSAGTPQIPNATVATGTNLSVGATQGGTGFLNGTLQCLILFNQTLPASTLALIQAWAKARYATP